MSSPDLCSKQGNSLSAVNDFCSIFIPTSPYVFRSWHLQTEVKQQQPEKRFRGKNLRKRQASHLTFKLCYWLQSSHQSYLAWPNHVGRFSVGSSKSWNGFPFQVSSEAKAQAFRPYTLMAPLTVWPVNLGKSIASVVTARASMTFLTQKWESSSKNLSSPSVAVVRLYGIPDQSQMGGSMPAKKS